MPRGTPVDLSSGTKLCPRCQTSKPLSEFYRSKATIHGYQVRCKSCSAKTHNDWRLKNLAHCAAEQKKHRQANPKRHADYARKYAYGLTPYEHAKLLVAQNGACAICKTTEFNGRRQLHVDHCHTTNRIRGLLCHGCNVSLGHFKHSTQILQAAIDYLNSCEGS